MAYTQGQRVYSKDNPQGVVTANEQAYNNYIGWGYTPNTPSVAPVVGAPVPPLSVSSASAAKTDVNSNVNTLNKAEASLIDIYNARPDVQATAKSQGGDPLTGGTKANTWLNDWYNQTGKAEGADMVAKGVIKLTGNPATDAKINEANDIISKTGDTTGVAEVNAAEQRVLDAVAAARNAKDSEDLLALKQSIADLKVAQTARQTTIDNLIASQSGLRDSYIKSLVPNAAEQNLQTQLVDLRTNIDKMNESTTAGLDKISGSPSAQGLKLGASAQLSKQADRAMTTQLNNEKNLIARLGLEQSNRQATSEGLKAGLGFLSEDIGVQMQVQQRLDQQEQNVLAQYEKYTAQQKQDMADILTSLAGVDPSTLSNETLAKLAQIAQQRGMSLQDILSGLQLEFDNLILAKSKEQAIINKPAQDQANIDRAFAEEQRQFNAQNSIAQQNADRLSGGGGGTGGGGGVTSTKMDTRVKQIVAMNPATGQAGGRNNVPNGNQWDSAAAQIDAEFGAGTATQYDSYLKSVYAPTKEQKPMNATQAKDYNYATRMQQSSDVFDKNEKYITGLNAYDYLYELQKPNIWQSSEVQQQMQAEQNFVNAVLRKESGAVISPSEFANAAKQYFYQPGDSVEVQKQKKQNRDLVIKNFYESAGQTTQETSSDISSQVNALGYDYEQMKSDGYSDEEIKSTLNIQ